MDKHVCEQISYWFERAMRRLNTSIYFYTSQQYAISVHESYFSIYSGIIALNDFRGDKNTRRRRTRFIYLYRNFVATNIFPSYIMKIIEDVRFSFDNSLYGDFVEVTSEEAYRDIISAIYILTLMKDYLVNENIIEQSATEIAFQHFNSFLQDTKCEDMLAFLCKDFATRYRKGLI